MTRLGLWIEDVPDAVDLSGYCAFLFRNDTAVIRALRKMPRRDAYAIVPDVQRYVRDMTKYGMVGMGIRRAWSLGPFNLLRLVPAVLKNMLGILKKKFTALVPLLVQIDYLELKKLKPRYLFLHYQLTDLALANNNKALIEAFLTRQTKDVKLGLMTKNLSLLEEKLAAWGIDAAVAAPFSSNGFGMRASQKECEALLKKNKREYFAFADIKSEDAQKEKNYLQKLGVKKAFISFS